MKIHGQVPRAEVLSAVKGAKLAVVIASVSEEGSAEIKGWIPAKLFEAGGVGAPVLLIAPPGSDAESITESTGLVHRISGGDINGIVSFIEERMSGTELRRTDVNCITWKYLSAPLDRILRNEIV